MEKFFSIIETMNWIVPLKFFDYPKDLSTPLSTLVEKKKNVVLIIF
jgi:hypothetical protein